MDPTWQAAQARHRSPELVDAAVEGVPLSRDHSGKTEPDLKSHLLDAGYAEGEDAFDVAMKDIRSGPPLFPPRGTAAED
ncbi:hypothetical protein JL101_035235 (plasmid) [Skermanella rosea]|uniref:hypothetical protein n=1 Tax=Skermanella rosea TaxID=1817965 RepID=UPI0019345DB5|nr:hypothetical protein [Skermanella rosea]UEM07825.1 hypothetical protein JL101_035235 [Skermanella rosea]